MDFHINITTDTKPKIKSYHIIKDIYKPYNDNPNLTKNRQFTCFSKDGYNFYCPENAHTYVRMLNQYKEGLFNFTKEISIIE